MPFRKIIGQALRRIVGIPNGDTASTAAYVAHKNHGEQQVHAEPTPENQTTWSFLQSTPRNLSSMDVPLAPTVYESIE